MNTIKHRMYRALLGTRTTDQAATAAARVAGQLLMEQRDMTQATIDGSLDDMKALLSDEAVERAARTLFAWHVAVEYPDSGIEWDDLTGEERGPWVDEARAALTAALGEEEDDE